MSIFLTAVHSQGSYYSTCIILLSFFFCLIKRLLQTPTPPSPTLGPTRRPLLGPRPLPIGGEMVPTKATDDDLGDDLDDLATPSEDIKVTESPDDSSSAAPSYSSKVVVDSFIVSSAAIFGVAALMM